MQRLIEVLGGFVGNVVSNDTALGGEYDFTPSGSRIPTPLMPARRSLRRCANSLDYGWCPLTSRPR